MDSFELNKIIAAVLLAALIIIGIGKFADVLFYVQKPEQSAYKVDGLEVVTTSKDGASESAKVIKEVNIKELLALGDVTHGEKVFKKCKACHVVDAEKHKTGPHLVNIMGRAAGSTDGYKKYANAMKSSGIVWNEDTLDSYLETPKAYAKGTRMLFADLRKKEDRANVIAYLKSY